MPRPMNWRNCGVTSAARSLPPRFPKKRARTKYVETAGAMVALLKYGAGLPFNRLEKLQECLGVPLPASTQWEIVERTADKIHPVYRELIRQAAQGGLLYNRQYRQ